MNHASESAGIPECRLDLVRYVARPECLAPVGFAGKISVLRASHEDGWADLVCDALATFDGARHGAAHNNRDQLSGVVSLDVV